MLLREPIPTQRLILRAEEPADAEDIYQMNCDPLVMRYTLDGKAWTSPLEEFREQFRAALERNADESWGGATILRKDTGNFLGLCWLAPSGLVRGGIELGYRYRAQAWGQGYATEAARAVVRVGFEAGGLDVIGAAVHPDNIASIRVLEKLGFQQLEDKFHPKANRKLLVYELDLETWTHYARQESNL